MKRLINTLMILLVVLVAGLSALVLLINPNDFRGYLEQSARQNGYQLTLHDPLRWHVLPQLSMLTGRVTLTASGASQPVISAENMRLDVELLPLLFHRLQLKQVVLNNAVILLSPQTEAKRPASAPIAPQDQHFIASEQGWKYTVPGLQITNSVLVFQPADKSPLTIRDVDLQLKQITTSAQSPQGQLKVSARINRNQRDLTLSFHASLNTAHYPQQLQMDITDLRYQVQGAGLPVQGISGGLAASLLWNASSQQLDWSKLQFSANNSQLTGSGTLRWQASPVWRANLHFSYLDLDNLLPYSAAEDSPLNSGIAENSSTDNALPASQSVSTQPAPMIASLMSGDYRALKAFSAQLSLQADQLQWRGLKFRHALAQLDNSPGRLTISKLQGQFASGTLALTGSLDTRADSPLFHFQPQLSHVPVAPLLQAFGYPAPFAGEVDFTGSFSGEKLTASDFRQHWQGQGQLRGQNLQLEGISIPALVSHSLADNLQTVPQPATSTDNISPATHLLTSSATVRLHRGTLTLSNLQAATHRLHLSGSSDFDLLHQQAEINLNIQLDDLPVSSDPLLTLLKNTPLPLRIYGSWNALSYHFRPSQILQDNLRQQARQRLRQWLQQEKAPELQTP